MCLCIHTLLAKLLGMTCSNFAFFGDGGDVAHACMNLWCCTVHICSSFFPLTAHRSSSTSTEEVSKSVNYRCELPLLEHTMHAIYYTTKFFCTELFISVLLMLKLYDYNPSAVHISKLFMHICRFETPQPNIQMQTWLFRNQQIRIEISNTQNPN